DDARRFDQEREGAASRRRRQATLPDCLVLGELAVAFGGVQRPVAEHANGPGTLLGAVAALRTLCARLGLGRDIAPAIEARPGGFDHAAMEALRNQLIDNRRRQGGCRWDRPWRKRSVVSCLLDRRRGELNLVQLNEFDALAWACR